MKNNHLTNIFYSTKLPEKLLVVTAGFHPKTVLSVGSTFKPVIQFEDFFNSDQSLWDTDKIRSNTKYFIKELLFLDGRRIIPAEIIQYISTKFDLTQLDYPVCIINNNATDFTPCYVNGDFESLFENVEKEFASTEEQQISEFYVNSIKTEIGLFVQSNVKSLFADEIVQEIDLHDATEIRISENFNPNASQYDFNHIGKDYFDLVLMLHRSEMPSEIEILIQTKEQITDELAYFVTACSKIYVAVNIVQARKSEAAKIRPAIHKIRDTYWSKGKEFRMVTFYADPAISNETIEISQGEIVEHIVSNVETAVADGPLQDIFITAPTGAGKSLLFQLAAIYLAEQYNYVSIIISPLKSLMKDQVDNLRDQGYHRVAYINSDISLIQREEILDAVKNGDIDIVYLAPELLLSYSLEFFIGSRMLGLLVVDEAHLVTTWGRDFRVDYWFLGNYIRKVRQLYKQKCIVVSLTATAVYGGPDDLVFETISSLNMLMPKLFVGVVRRNDIEFNVNRTEFEKDYEASRNELTVRKVGVLLNHEVKSIVYFPWTNQIDDVYNKYRGETTKLGMYHSKLGKEYRLLTADQFREGIIDVVLASKAFGMGVDIPDIAYVYHHAPSGTLADYVQEIGRAARLPFMQGTAAIDFSVKDLRYTKVLWGLSAIRQWQVKQSLSKLISLYHLRKKRNFLVNIDDFSFLFPNSEEGIKENKIKSTLMLIEKDFLKKHRYPVVLVRPKSLFTTVFLRVENSVKGQFLAKYGDYVNKLEGVEIEQNKTELNEVFKVKLDKLWEELMPDTGFPNVKHEFYNGSLFGELSAKVHPQLKLMIKLNDSITKTRTALDTSLAIIERILGSLSGKFFRRDTFMKALIEEGFSSETAESISDVFLNYYSSRMVKNRRTGRYYLETAGAFLQQRKRDGEATFKVIDSGFAGAKETLRKLFNDRFKTSSTVFAYITTDKQKNRNRILLAYVLEALKLGVYELHGGEKPQLFIRINDPSKVMNELKYYRNSLVDEIEQRHLNSIGIMENFFMSDMTTEERWDFIEQYFLGRLPTSEGD
jgi:ATP-dependent DNA helicase RecQ